MLRIRFLRHIALIAVPALLLTACPAEEPDDEPQADDTPETDTAAEEEEVDRADGVLNLGYVLPESGPLAFLGPPQISAAEYAVDQINEAGGVVGADVELSSGDEAGDTAVASESADRLLQQGVDAIIGAAATGMSLAIVDQVTGAGVVQCSGSNTGPVFTDYEDDGFYFRTAPTDALQGPVLAETIVNDGNSQVALAARADDYGEGLLEATRDALEEQGADVVEEVLYDPEAATFDSEVQQLADADPDAVALIAFDEGAQILQGMIEAGIGPEEISVYGADGIRSSDLPEDVEPGNPNVLDGMKGTAPDPSADPEFLNNLQEFDPELEETTFSGQVYDCVNIIALAAVAADSDDPSVFVDEMVEVTREGTECTDFAECSELLADGEDIDYQGATNPDFTEDGEPDRGLYEVWAFEDGELVTVETQESVLE